MKKINPVIALAALLAIAACGDDDDPLTGPGDPQRSCNVGSIDVGGTRDFTLGSGFGCTASNVAFEPGTPEDVFAASYTVRLQAGVPYSIEATDRGTASDPDLDMTLLLFGPGDDTTEYGWVAASDDEGSGDAGYNPHLVFVPRVTGVYAVRVSGYFDVDEGPARLAVRTCTLGPTPGNTAATGTIPANACDLAGTPFVVHQVQLPAAATRTITVHSDDFSPSVFIGGPGQDIWDYGGFGNVWDSDFGSVADAAVSFTTQRAGTYTVLVGSYSGGTGSYTIRMTGSTTVSGSVGAVTSLPRVRSKASRR